MERKTLFIIIGIAVVLTIGFFLAGYIITKKDAGEVTDPKNPFVNLFPFGNPDDATAFPPSSDDNQGSLPNTDDIINPVSKISLKQISSQPTAGANIIANGEKTYVEYVQKETGHVFEVNLDDLKSGRLSNKIIPRIYQAYIGNNGKSVMVRGVEGSLETIKSYVMTVAPSSAKNTGSATVNVSSTTTVETGGFFLPDNITDVIVSGKGDNAFFLTKTAGFENRTTTGSLYDFKKGSYSTVFQSKFSDWLPVLFEGNKVAMQTKASNMVPGYLYSFDVYSGELKKLLSDKNGLVALPSPDFSKIIYSVSTRGGVELFILNIKENETTALESLKTLADKCVWRGDSKIIYCAVPNNLPLGLYPDSWYQGETSFNDTIWEINAVSEDIKAVMMPETLGVPTMDITNLILSKNNDYIVFTNKKDSSLWAFKTNGEW